MKANKFIKKNSLIFFSKIAYFIIKIILSKYKKQKFIHFFEIFRLQKFIHLIHIISSLKFNKNYIKLLIHYLIFKKIYLFNNKIVLYL